MTDFLENHVLGQGILKDHDIGDVVFPPSNRTEWDGQHRNFDTIEIFDFLREKAYMKDWDPFQCMSFFPSNGDLNSTKMGEILTNSLSIENDDDDDNDDDNPVPIDASFEERVREQQAGRTEGCFYDEKMEKAPVIHFKSQNQPNTRMLVPFYSFLHYENWKQDTWTKRFVRDHFRYSDQVFCAAGRIVASIRKKAREYDPDGNPDGLFHSMHIRRGDFQYKMTRKDASELIKASRDKLKDNSTLFIATDERDKSFFEPFKLRGYNILFLDDFTSLIEGLNTNYFGLIDQLIASRGVTFHGTYYSTFTAYINRLRGYYSIRDKADGYKNGELQSYFFFPAVHRNDMRRYRAVSQPFWASEFPPGWRDIDEGIPA